MPGQVAAESPAATRRQLLTENVTSSAPISRRIDAKADKSQKSSRHRSSHVGEAAGGCAAVCCCCPCAVMHIVILAVYRVPASLWRKKNRKRLLKKKRKNKNSTTAEEEKEIHWRTSPLVLYPEGEEEEEEEGEDSTGGVDRRGENDVVEWENGMWDRFYGGGFWRSGSQRTHGDW